jgi:mannosyltransferase OCH1-like enzyme
VVCHFGGVYADLDCESLKPLDDLLAGQDLVFGLEPPSHVKRPAVASRGFTRVVCNALFASVPGHPFWPHLFQLLATSKNEGNVLECAGPFALTRACDSYPSPQDITILPSNVLYPLDNYLRPTTGRVDPHGPYTVHHWSGSWWRDAVINSARRRILAARAGGCSGEAR